MLRRANLKSLLLQGKKHLLPERRSASTSGRSAGYVQSTRVHPMLPAEPGTFYSDRFPLRDNRAVGPGSRRKNAKPLLRQAGLRWPVPPEGRTTHLPINADSFLHTKTSDRLREAPAHLGRRFRGTEAVL